MSVIDVNWSPPPKVLRQFGFVFATVLVALVAWLKFRRGIWGWEFGPQTVQTASWSLAAAALIVAFAAAVRPVWLLWPYRALTAISLPIGWVVSHTLLAMMYFGVFTPMATIFRLIGRDVLGRRFDPSAESYWDERPPAPPPQRYYRQF